MLVPTASLHTVRSLALLALLSSTMLGCDKFYVAFGKVKDCTDQQPIVGAKVHLELTTSDGDLKQDDSVSGKDGSFSAVLNEPESDLPSRLSVQASGHVAFTKTVTNPHQAQDICLERGTK